MTSPILHIKPVCGVGKPCLTLPLIGSEQMFQHVSQ